MEGFVAKSVKAKRLLVSFFLADFGMHLNQGKFRKNGGCGYILKPESLRNRGENDRLAKAFRWFVCIASAHFFLTLFLTEKSNYHPMIKESPKDGKSCYFNIEVQWPICLVNSVDETNNSFPLPHRRSTTVSLKTKHPLFICKGCSGLRLRSTFPGIFRKNIFVRVWLLNKP